ncbi:MAG: GcrA cell cycle regulator, partial [Alphaproteobacteria bacterium]|nr:GcrA cell cycle regulator [Alphaproteobacteria bacterium]
MSWTDERVELLRKLWNQGLSASQIATELANGITRNAVIGKVHRLGLSGRAKAPSSQAARPRKITRAPSHPLTHSANRAGLGSYSSAAAGQAAIRGNLALSPSPVTAEAVAPVVAYDPEPFTDVVVPMSERITIMELRES